MSTTISSLLGNGQWLDGGAMFGNAPRPVWEKWLKPDGLGRIPLACRALLIEHEGQRILCETGIGAFFEPKLAERYGVQDPTRHRLLESLHELGLKEEDINYVILSHLHFDHAGGLLPTYRDIQAGHDGLLFPRATYVVGQEAWRRSLKPHPRDRASFIPGLSEKLEKSGRLLVVDGATSPQVFPEHLRFFISHGHTPGQMHTIFRGEQTSVVFAGDLIPGTSWVHLPITMGYDRYPELLIDEKAQLYAEAVPQHWWVFYTHDPQVATSQIADRDGKFVPLATKEAVLRLAI